MKRKITILALFLSTLLVSPIFASAGMDISLTYQKSIEDNNGETIDNPYPFSAILLPHYENGKFLMELRLPLAFGAGDESTDTFTSIDLSIYQPIKKEVSDTNSEFIFKNISHYLKLISYIQYGYDWQDFNIRFGKISNSTIGDGALLYHYRDTSIASYDTRPGLKFKLDGKYFNLGLVGIEGITNDLFTPDFYGGRIYVKPFYYTDTPILNESKIGFTEITYNSSTPSKEIYHSVALDLNIPLIKNDDYSMILYHDIINSKNFDPLSSEDLFKAKDDRTISWRTGIQGRYFSALSYNAYFQSFIDKNSEDTDNLLLSDINQMLKRGLIPLITGNYKVYGETGYYTTNGDGFFVIDSLLNFEDTNLESYTVGAKFKSYKPILMLNNIKLSVEKEYITKENSNKLEEKFIEGLFSAKNVAFSIQSDVQYGISVFNIGLSSESDDEGKFDTTYKFGFRISLFQ